MTEMKENCRKQTGNLKINNTLYPIYEGLNIIGRDIKATVVLKETIFSKLHAAISVVDANIHLICDLNSSNGTQLGKLKLDPYKFYSIKDHEAIIFGDVVAMYFVGVDTQSNCVIKVSTQNVDNEAETQILNNLNNTVENIHDLPTQTFVTGIHEAPTQIFGEVNNIHETLTQKLPETNSLTMHEAPTQHFLDTKNKNENSILGESSTEICLETNNETGNKENYNIDDSSDDDETQDLDTNIEEVPKPKNAENSEETPKTESGVYVEKVSENKTDEDATQYLEVPQKQNNEDTIKDSEVAQTQNDDILSRTEVYDDIFANETFRSSLEQSVTELEAVEVDETVLVQSEKNIEEFKKPENQELKTHIHENDGMSDDDDIILSTQDSEAIDQKYREHQEEINSTKENLNDVSDSDATDVEDEQLLIANTSYPEQNTEVADNVEMVNIVNEVIIENDVNDNSDEEELDLLSSTILKSDSSTQESIKNNESLTKEAELAPTQLLVANDENKSSDEETDDELPATQLLHLNSNKQVQQVVPELGDNDDIYFAATQKISVDIDENQEAADPSPKSNSNIAITTDKSIDESISMYSAETQFLPPENDVEDEFSAETQLLPLETENPVVSETATAKEPIKDTVENAEESIFSAATQILPNKPETSKNQDENDDRIFSATTQKLNPEAVITKPKERFENDEENIFSAATQILTPPNESGTKKITETNETDIFLAPTQVMVYPENQVTPDDIFSAPTQILLGDVEEIPKKSSESAQLSSESIDESMRLHLSETEHSVPNLNQEMHQQQQQNTETQLEVDFELETQKLYIEERTSRPDNPLSHIFAEESTEQFDDEINEDYDKNEDLNTSVENATKLKPIISLVDIKKSKITLKDIQEASTSKTKKSHVKLERIKLEPTRRSNRNPRGSVKQEEPDKVVLDHEATEQVETIEAKTPRRRARVATSEAPTTNATKEETDIKEDKPSKRRSTKNSIPAELKIQEIKTNKEVSTEDANPKPKEKSEEIVENFQDNYFKTSSGRHNTRGKRRDYKSIVKGDAEIEFETKNVKSKISSKSFMRDKIEELEIHVKEETTKRTAIKNTNDADSDDSVFRSKRSKRSNNKEKEEIPEKNVTNEDSDGSSIEIRVRRKVPRIEATQECESKPKRITRTTRIKQETVEEIKETKDGRTNRVLRNTRKSTKINRGNGQDSIFIEDSDDDILETNKKLQENKIEQSKESGKSTCTAQIIQTRKRNSQLSPERNKPSSNSSDICLNTPNSKRRRYEPLSVNISSSQLNNEPEHQVVFTMLNDTNLESIVRKLGGSVVDSIQSCTVLVTNKISRSLKFLIAVALGKPIVHVKWILDSDKHQKFLDPWDYLLEDPESEVKFKMSLKDSLTTSRKKKLFSGETILLAASKNFQVLKEIIETSGGKCITRALPKTPKTIVVCYEEERSKYSKYLKQKTFIVVSAEAIFSGVLQQKINWKQYLLS